MRATRRGRPRGRRPPRPAAGPPHLGAVLTTTAAPTRATPTRAGRPDHRTDHHAVGGAGGDARAGSRRWVRSAVLVVLVLLVVTQRLALPVAGLAVPLALPLGLGLAALLLVTRSAQWDRSRVELYALAAPACVAAALVSTTLAPAGTVTSLVLLLVIYLPWLLRAAPELAPLGEEVAALFVRLMLVLAAVGVVQLLAQYAGLWSYSDLVRRFVPAPLVYEGFNNSIPLSYGSSVYKSAAFVFLEPSFFSQSCALAVLVALVRRAPVWQLVVLVAGLASAVSGTGVLLLGVGGVVVLLRARHLVGPAHLLTAAALVVAVLLSPVGRLLLARSTETSEQGSSGYLRFVQPYVEVAAGLDGGPLRYLVGAGPGTAERLLTSGRGGVLGEFVVYGIVPKLVFEYGLLAASLVVLLLLVTLVERARGLVLPTALVVFLFVLSGSLLQPHTLYLAWLLGPLWARAPQHQRVPQGRLLARAVAARGGPGRPGGARGTASSNA